MTSQNPAEVAALLARAKQSIEAARQLASGEYHDFAASRAYYAAFYAAKAVLLQDGLEFSKHSRPSRPQQRLWKRSSTCFIDGTYAMYSAS